MLTLGTPVASALMDLSRAEPARLLRLSRATQVGEEVEADATTARRRSAIAVVAAELAARAAAEAASTLVEAVVAANAIALAQAAADPRRLNLAIAAATAAELDCLRDAALATVAAQQAQAAADLVEIAVIPLEQHPCSKATQVHSF